MKKGKIISIFVIIIIGILILHYGYTACSENQTVQMDGHRVERLLNQYYDLNNEALKNVETTLNQLDGLIEESFNEAISKRSISLNTAKKRIAHMQRVSFLALELMKAYEESEGVNFTKQQAEDLMIAAYLHDIRKYADGNHAKQGANYVLENLPNYINIDELRLERISQLIKYHSNSLSEKQMAKLGEDAILAQLLQDADTADKIINRDEDEDLVKTLNLQSSIDVVAAYQGK